MIVRLSVGPSSPDDGPARRKHLAAEPIEERMSEPAAATDHELMFRTQHGDAVAFEELVRRWQHPIGRMVGHLLGSHAEVDDLCQEVFLRVLRARDRYRATHAFSTWVYQIALNVARDSRRRSARRRQEQLPQTETVSSVPTPADALAQHETVSAITAAVEMLSDELREVLVLKHFGKLSFSEVAQATGLPLSTVKSRVQAAMKRLRSELIRRGIKEGE